MGIIDRRLGRLEGRFAPHEAELLHRARTEFYRRLTDEELDWLSEPEDEAARLVPCPKLAPVRCDCLCPQRSSGGFAEYPELKEEADRRWRHLLGNAEEIMSREIP